MFRLTCLIVVTLALFGLVLGNARPSPRKVRQARQPHGGSLGSHSAAHSTGSHSAAHSTGSHSAAHSTGSRSAAHSAGSSSPAAHSTGSRSPAGHSTGSRSPASPSTSPPASGPTTPPGSRPRRQLTHPVTTSPSHPQIRPHSPVQLSSESQDNWYSHFILALQTQGGVCADGKSNNRPCLKESRRTGWTIHGLWPSLKGTSPAFCSLDKFDGRLLESVKLDLNRLWPSFTATQDRYFTFWRHEWQKHGTCAKNLNALRGVTNYFNSTLQLAKKYDVTRYLSQGCIEALDDVPHPITKFKEAISKHFPYKFDIFCDTVKGKNVVQQIYLCFDKTLKPIHCSGRQARCAQEIYYVPPF